MRTKKNIELNHSSKEINSNFRIKVYGMVNGVKKNVLVGVKGLIEALGGAIDMVNKVLDRVFKDAASGRSTGVCACKLRRGIKITFYMK